MRLRPINIYRYEEIRDETSRVQNKTDIPSRDLADKVKTRFTRERF